MPRLWLRQVPTLILAYHEQGVFRDINVQDVRASVGKWKDENQDILARFAGLLERIVGFARDQPVSKLEITCDEGSDTLYVREQIAVAMSAFSPPVEDRWNRGSQTMEQLSMARIMRKPGSLSRVVVMSWVVSTSTTQLAMMSVATVVDVHIKRLRKNWVLFKILLSGL